jgi:hypothetical protein
MVQATWAVLGEGNGRGWRAEEEGAVQPAEGTSRKESPTRGRLHGANLRGRGVLEIEGGCYLPVSGYWYEQISCVSTPPWLSERGTVARARHEGKKNPLSVPASRVAFGK